MLQTPSYKIGKIAVGVVLLVVFILAVGAVLFGTGGAVPNLSAEGFLWFCIGVIVILVVLFVIEFILNLVAGWMGVAGELVALVKYVIFAVALIALLVVADRTLLGGAGMAGFNSFRFDHHSQLDVSPNLSRSTAYLQPVLTKETSHV